MAQIFLRKLTMLSSVLAYQRKCFLPAQLWFARSWARHPSKFSFFVLVLAIQKTTAQAEWFSPYHQKTKEAPKAKNSRP